MAVRLAAWLVAGWVAAAPIDALAAERATFLFELDGVPVGTVELSVDLEAGSYRYTSLHLFTRDGQRAERARTAEYRVDARGRDAATGLAFESLWLWRGPREVGCVDGREELGGRKGKLCLTRSSGAALSGTVFGQSWTARLESPGGELQWLQVGSARFVRARGERPEAPPDVLGRAFEIAGPPEGALTLKAVRGKPFVAPSVPRAAAAIRAPPSPSVARALSARVHASFDQQLPSAADFGHDDAARTAGCLGHARRYVAWARRMGFDAFIVHGLVVPPGAASAGPHAWVRVKRKDGWQDLDPTLELDPSPRTHLPLGVSTGEGDAEAGRTWLRLFSGELRVVRSS